MYRYNNTVRKYRKEQKDLQKHFFNIQIHINSRNIFQIPILYKGLIK